MGKDGVLAEIDRRIKRLEAEISMAEERMRYLEGIGASTKYRTIRRKDYTVHYLILMGAWIITGTLALIFMKNRLPHHLNVPLTPYLLMALVLLVVPGIYLLLARGEMPSTPMEDLEEREKLARILLNRFYRPLREAVGRDDRERMKVIADELLGNPLLASAIERMAEGDPKLNAYALYLYANYKPGLEDEVSETVEKLTNRPLKALLLELLKG